MKQKWTALALALCLTLTACGGANTGSNNGGQSQNVQNQGGDAADTYRFTLKGVEVAVDAEMAPIAGQLGDPTSYFASESCAFQGLDKVYTYGSVIIRTYPQDGVDYVLSVELMDDTVSTPEGVRIGSPQADVIAAYGEPTEATAAALIYGKGSCTLTFLMTNDEVSAITYTSVAAGS